jgi:hypothetical protein
LAIFFNILEVSRIFWRFKAIKGRYIVRRFPILQAIIVQISLQFLPVMSSIFNVQL